jgi:hypothetical protein
MSRDGKRMVMWSSDSRRHRTCTPDSFARAVRSTLIPLVSPRHHLENSRPTQNQEYHR